MAVITGRQEQIFKQCDLLAMLKCEYNTRPEEQKIVSTISNGICYMLSMEWLLKLLQTPNAYPASIYDTDFVKNKAYFKQIANNYYKYSVDFKYTFTGRQEIATAEKVTDEGPLHLYWLIDMDAQFAKSCSVNRYTVQKVIGPLYSSIDITANHQTAGTTECHALLLYLNVQDYGGIPAFGHEMAIWCKDNKYYFYDPNQGVYMLNDLSSIVGEILNGYAPHIPTGVSKAYLAITEIIKK